MSLMVLEVMSAMRAWGNGTSKDQLWRLKTAGTADIGAVSVWSICTARSMTPFLLVHTRLPSHPVTHYCRRLKMNFSERKKKNEKNCPKCGYKAKQTSLQLWLHSLHKVLRQPLYIQSARHVTALCPHWCWNWAVDALCRD